MEDAVALARSVDSNPDIGAAFGSYVDTRYPRASQVQTRSRMFGELLHVNGTMAAFRDHMLRGRSDLDYRDIDWLYGHSVLSASTREGEPHGHGPT
jgi:salicylate hydroxylase